MGDEGWWGRLRSALGDRRVVPPDPPNRSAYVPPNDPAPAMPEAEPDDAATWTAQIVYGDAAGEMSERKITIRRISGHFGRPELIHALCHKRKSSRAFRVDRIQEMICVVTGELIDPYENAMLLHRLGALTIEDKALTKLAQLLVFMARCDGSYHPLENSALEDILGRYARFFGGDDDTIATALHQCGRLAPTADDMVLAIRSIQKMPLGPELCRFTLDSGAAIIDADGRHAPEEISWALELSDGLKRMATRQ